MENLVAEIRMFSAPKLPEYGWLACDGKSYPIVKYQKLFGLIGNQFGSDQQGNFNVPDLRGRLPMGSQRDGFKQGQPGGFSATTLVANNLPPHTHAVNVIAVPGATEGSPLDALFGAPNTDSLQYYSNGAGGNLVAMDPNTTGNTGTAIPVSNIQPIIGLIFAIAYDGIYPERA